jgi:hypothetical protein
VGVYSSACPILLSSINDTKGEAAALSLFESCEFLGYSSVNYSRLKPTEAICKKKIFGTRIMFLVFAGSECEWKGVPDQVKRADELDRYEIVYFAFCLI